MPEFTPITTQEEFDQAIAARLDRERRRVLAPFADYDEIKANLSTAQQTLSERDATIANLNTQLQSTRSDLAKTRIALEKHLPMELAGRLTGETDEELRADADNLSKLLGGSRRNPEPPHDPEPSGGSKMAKYQTLLNDLNLGGN